MVPARATAPVSVPALAPILVVDDNDALRENLAEALELEGYPVAVAASGEDALARLAEEPLPRLVLLDLRMPGMGGDELLSRIRSDPRLRAVRVVITTGDSGSRSRVAAADGVLMKPFGVADLLAALQRAGVAEP